MRGNVAVLGTSVPIYRLAVVLLAVAVAAALWLLIERSRIGAMIRAGVDDAPIARAMGIKVSSLFTAVLLPGGRPRRLRGASWARPSCPSIRASMPTCCRWR